MTASYMRAFVAAALISGTVGAGLAGATAAAAKPPLDCTLDVTDPGCHGAGGDDGGSGWFPPPSYDYAGSISGYDTYLRSDHRYANSIDVSWVSAQTGQSCKLDPSRTGKPGTTGYGEILCR